MQRIVMPHGQNEEDTRFQLESIRQSEDSSIAERRLFYAALSSVDDKDEEVVSLFSTHLEEPVRLSCKTWKSALKSSGRKGIAEALARLRRGESGSHVLIVGMIERRPDGTLWIQGLNLLVFSEHWILVDSKHELKAVNACVAQRLRFWKPLRPVEGLGYIPDLIIYLDDGWLIWEIGGSDKPDYLHHLWEKSVRYEATYPGRWGIWLAEPEEMPDFSCIPLPRDTHAWRLADEEH